MTSSVFLILSRIIRSLFFLVLVKELSTDGVDFYELYTTSLILLVILPQIVSQRLVNGSLINVEELGFLLKRLMIVSCIALPIVTVFFGIKSIFLALLPFYILEVPFFSNAKIKQSIKVGISAVQVVLVLLCFYSQIELIEFIAIDTIFKCLVYGSLVFLLTKKSKCKEMKSEAPSSENISIAYLSNGLIGLSKYRFVDLILINIEVSNTFLLINRVVDMCYGYVSIISASLFSRGYKKEGLITSFYLSKYDRVSNVLLLILAILFYLVYFLLSYENQVVEVFLITSFLISSLGFWWLELAYYAKIRILHAKYTDSIKLHLCDFSLYIFLLFLIFYANCSSDNFKYILVIPILFIVYPLMYFFRQKQRSWLHEYIVNK